MIDSLSQLHALVGRELVQRRIVHCIVATGDALKLGELVDHARLQIRLGNFSSSTRKTDVYSNLIGNSFCNLGYTLSLISQASQISLVRNGLQALVHRGEALLQVFVEEELGVGEARADHALVALADFAFVARFDVGDADEVLGEPAVRIQHREELLVGFHRRDQRFLRHGEEFALERAEHGLRPLDQALHLFEVVVGLARRAAGTRGGGIDLGDDAVAALLGIDQHLGGAQGVDVITRRADPHRTFVMETMAAAHAVGLRAEDFGIDHGVPEQQHQPVHRAGEAAVALAPAHRLGNGHAGQGLGHDLRQQVGGLRARLHGAQDEALALVVGGLFQRGPVDAGLGREAFQRPGRLAFGIERDVEVRPQHFAALLGLLHGHAGQQHGEAARGVERLRVVAPAGDAALVERGDHAVEKGLGQTRQGLDREFLGTEFDQKGAETAHAEILGVGGARTRQGQRPAGALPLCDAGWLL